MKTGRPRLTPKALAYIACNLFGMVLFATGALWLMRGLPLFFRDFPSTKAEAFIALVGGLVLMVYAMSRALREMFAASLTDSRANAEEPPP